MHVKLRLTVLAAMATLAALAASLALAQEAPESPEVAACQPGAGYASGCDVDQDGDIDILDVQRTAGRWNSSGVYTAGHTHWGETWTGATGSQGLRLEHTAGSGESYGVVGVASSTLGTGIWGQATASTGLTAGVIGESASSEGAGVYGRASAGSGTTYGVRGRSDSVAGRGVYGYVSAASGETSGVQGQSASPDGRGVFGLSTASSGFALGVSGESASSDGRGVYGKATASSGQAFGVHGESASTAGRGVFGHATSSSGSTYGVVGQANSSSGAGVQGYAASATGNTIGVWGLSLSTSGTGVSGTASATTGANVGVYGQSSSDQGYGVYGVTWSHTGVTYAVYGRSLSTSGHAGYFSGGGADAVVIENIGSGRGLQVETTADTAIWALTDTGLAGVDGRNASSTGRGVYGYATAASGANFGVYGRTASASGYAGYFQGNLHTTGTLSKAAGSFKIDHPLDPANQYLYHSFVESPDMMNIYNGNATLDEQGEAQVELPDWFEALNQDFRYQLTPIGGWAPLYIAQEIQGNAFRIAGGQPDMKVSWQITGIRHDAYANAHRIPVEEPKPAGERGLYLHPTELGQPAESGLDYQRNAGEAQQTGADDTVPHEGAP